MRAVVACSSHLSLAKYVTFAFRVMRGDRWESGNHATRRHRPWESGIHSKIDKKNA